MALSHIGNTTTIEDLAENSTEAQLINTWYDMARKQALSALNWSFARKRLMLALHSDDAPVEWTYVYQYPVDALVVRKLTNPLGKTADAVPYEVEASEGGDDKKILTDLAQAEAVYTFDQDNADMFSDMFANALSYLLAHYISYPLTNKWQVRERCLQQYYIMLRIAGATGANEQVPAKPRDAEEILARE